MGDLQTQIADWRAGVQWGWLSVNEVRAKRNLDPIEGGDVHLSPKNMQPLDFLVEAMMAEIEKKRDAPEANSGLMIQILTDKGTRTSTQNNSPLTFIDG